MRRSHVSNATGAGLNMTPLIDMMFILLIFFVTTASFVKESGIDVNRPSAETAVRKELGNILVSVTRSGDIWIEKRRVDVRAVRGNIERLRAENPEGSVVIVADRDAQVGLVVQVMDQARLAGVANVSIAASQDEAGAR